MNSNHKDGNDDRSLDHELDQLDQLYHSEESIEPPDLIDQAVLNKARRAVEPKNGWLDFGWIHGVTTVALVVLTFSIFTTQQQTGEFEQTVGKSVDRTPAQATGQLSAEAVSDQALSDKVISSRVSSSQGTSERAASKQADEADVSKVNRAASPAVDAAGTSVSSLPIEAPKKEIWQETRTRDQDAIQSQMSAPASVAPAPLQSAKRQSQPNIVSESNEEEANRLNEADTTDKLDSAPELKDSGFISQQQLLDKILALNQAGDNPWVKELSDFKKLYPDFPIPQELQN